MFYIILIAIIIFIGYKQYQTYINSTYYKQTKNNLIKVWYNSGMLGEYMTYKELKDFEIKAGKFLFNVYLPKEDGTTTEIDVLLITRRGLFVFESKNYSGWIFGDEHQKNWTQSLPSGRGRSHKEHFFNPIFQNNGHINNLKRIIGEEKPYYSIITFSERCTLKKVPNNTKFVKIIKRNNVWNTVLSIYNNIENVMTSEEVKEIYDKLLPYTQVDAQTKMEHITNIKTKY